MKYLLLFFSLSFLIIAACKSQNEEKHTDQKEKKIEQVQIKDSVYKPIDLKLLSKFIDTLRIEHFHSEINKFKEDDSLYPNRKIDIVFVGSSSIRKWESLEKDMHGLKVLNRGFGGSTIPEAIYYSDILFFKHKPKKIVFYSGDNDVAWLNTSTEKIIESYKLLYKILNLGLPKTSIYILSIKPSPARWRFWPQMKDINSFLKEFCYKKENWNFIDVSSPMIDSTGNVRKELFIKDRIHLNKQGYQLWADIIFPVVSK